MASSFGFQDHRAMPDGARADHASPARKRPGDFGISASDLPVVWLNAWEHLSVLSFSRSRTQSSGGQGHVGSAVAHASSRCAVTALTVGVVFLGGATSANAKDSADAQVKNYQEQFIDPQAPVGTEAKSSKKASAKVQLDSPVETKAANPDSASDLRVLADAAGGEWEKLPSLPSGSNAYHLIMGPGGKILLIAGSGNNSAVFDAGTFKAYIWEPTTGHLRQLTNVPHDMFCAGHMLMSNGQALPQVARPTTSPWKGSKALYTFDFGTEKFKRQRTWPTAAGTQVWSTPAVATP